MTVFPHNLRTGTDVYSQDGEKLGNLHRVVMKRSDLTLTHIVVDIGFLRSGRSLWEGGLGLDYDRIIPIEDVASVTDDRVELSLIVNAFKEMPEYTDEIYEPADPSPNEFDITDVVTTTGELSSVIGSTPGAWLVPRLNKPVTSVDLVEGSDVWRQEPHEKLGDLKRVLLDETSGQVKALVISRGFILKHDVVLPTRYISELFDGVVRVEIGDAEIEQLKRYEDDA